MNCPCGLKPDFSECCGPFLEGSQVPETAEQLMRSRYTAFSRVDMEYLSKTSHPKLKNELDVDGNRQWAESSKWLNLEIVRTEGGQPGDVEGVVEFIASYEQANQVQKHHEIGKFRHYKNRWVYFDGKNPTQTITNPSKIGRNDPCSCGSGKKFKKCCGNL